MHSWRSAGSRPLRRSPPLWTRAQPTEEPCRDSLRLPPLIPRPGDVHQDRSGWRRPTDRRRTVRRVRP
ncbi:hypothetical protein ACFFX0_16380 [Citricoccus parietis]|uniref:Uncharacterized protein n=1 Tax=Citricoccus parietis TaxID=592307 RepID=A0ABV5G2J1_9MICC